VFEIRACWIITLVVSFNTRLGIPQGDDTVYRQTLPDYMLLTFKEVLSPIPERFSWDEGPQVEVLKGHILILSKVVLYFLEQLYEVLFRYVQFVVFKQQ
jgi:hypothetical protein